jgi:hypothetical protein
MTLRFALYLLLLVVVFVIGVLQYKKRPAPFQALTLLVGVTVVSEILGRCMTYWTRNSSPVYHVYIILLYLFYAWIYRELSTSPAVKKAILISAPVFVALSFVNSLYYQSVKQFPSNMLLIACVLIIFLSLLIYRQMLSFPIEESLFRQPVFWLNTGTLFFFTTTFLFWSFFNYFIRQKLNLTLLTDMIYLSNIIYYVVLGISLLL